MKMIKTEISMSRDLILGWGLAYVGGSVLKITCPRIKHLGFKAVAFSASLVSTGTLFGKKKVAQIFQLDFDQISQSYGDYFLKIALLIKSAIGALLLSQCHRFTLSFPRFTYLSFRDCFTLGMAQGLSVSIPLLWNYSRPKLKEVETEEALLYREEALERSSSIDEASENTLDSLERMSTHSGASLVSDSSIEIINTETVDNPLENPHFFQNRRFRRSGQ